MPTWAWLALVAGVALLAGGGRAAFRPPRRRR
jgi:hypothetical protein